MPVLHPAYVMRGRWEALPLIAATFVGGLTTEPWEPPRIVHSIMPTRALSLDIETDASGAIDLIGLSFNGRDVRQLALSESGELLEHLGAAEQIFIHNAEFDVTKLRQAGVVFDESRVIDTMIAQAAFASDLEVGLDNALAISLPGRWTYHKSLSGESRAHARDRAFTRQMWRKLLALELEPTPVEWYRIYNMLDVASTWRLGHVLEERMS